MSRREQFVIRNFTHSSETSSAEPLWSSVDKTKLPRQAFADQGSADMQSSWKYPHHWVENGGGENADGVYTTGTMYLSKGGLDAAWSAANGGRSGEEASSAIKAHLQAHRHALGLDNPTKDYMRNQLTHEDKKPWYQIKALSEGDGGPVEIMIYDEIGQNFWGEGVTAKQFIDDVKQCTPQDLLVRINSPGGNVQDGLAIYNCLTKYQGKVDCVIDGFALSTASFVAMAGDTLSMPENTWLMIHKPYVMCVGNDEELVRQADVLRRMGNSLADIYAKKCNLSRAKILDMMTQETWMTAAEAQKCGMCQEVTPGMRVAAKFDLSPYRNIPQSVREYRPLFNHAQKIAARLQTRTAEWKRGV